MKYELCKSYSNLYIVLPFQNKSKRELYNQPTVENISAITPYL